jgi:hypothetical protein
MFCSEEHQNITVYTTFPVRLLIKNHAMKKTHGRVKGQLHIFLNLALDGNERSASFLCHCTPRETVPSTHWIIQ